MSWPLCGCGRTADFMSCGRIMVREFGVEVEDERTVVFRCVDCLDAFLRSVGREDLVSTVEEREELARRRADPSSPNFEG